ncbi:MAG: dihydroflavonol 4-reductase [Mycobacterium sp.]|nr:dihydroflavonol 4-reductase [Mycobacterium sp.]
MDDAVMITGATGLIGSNVCKLLTEQGRRVRALVRPGSETAPLAALGVELIEGDITSADDVARAAEGTVAIINSAALLGGAAQDAQASQETNYGGSLHCYDAAVAGEQRVIELATTTFLVHDEPLNEHPTVRSEINDDPYSLSKGAAFRDGMRRAEDGGNIVFVIPGGTFGPSPCPQRALSTTSYNRLVRAALRGRLTDYVSYPVPWVRAEDVARVVVAAIDRGKAGDCYLAFGREDAMTTAAFLNVACEVGGVDNRLAEVTIDPDDPAAAERYGSTLVALTQHRFPVPWFDNSYTRKQLDYEPVALRDALEETVAWLRATGNIG